VSAAAHYDTIGRGYTRTRRPDPRIERQVWSALGDATSVVNVGAGAGSYEPRDRFVVAVDPSDVMLAQRESAAAPAVKGVAEALPFPSGSFDASLTCFTIHHWSAIDTGLAELRRVSRRHVVLTFDQPVCEQFWGWRDYFSDPPEVSAARTPLVDRIADRLDADRIDVVPVPWDCNDGFGAAYWRRPEAYLDPAVQASISSLAEMAPERIASATARLRTDLESGEWERRNGHLLGLDEADVGYRLIVKT
jgi:SAM-dependent methyltransferase